jgi:spore maturation protein CgeB
MVMNINRSSMANVGFSPPTRIFEAAGCGACLLCDEWPGIEECFTPGNEILIIRSAEDVVDALERYDSGERMRMGRAFHARALREHSYARRAERAEQAFLACLHRQDQTTTVAPVATIPVGEPA